MEYENVHYLAYFIRVADICSSWQPIIYPVDSVA